MGHGQGRFSLSRGVHQHGKKSEMKHVLSLLTALLLALTLAAVSAHAEIVMKNGEKVAFLGDSITAQGWSSLHGYVRLVVAGLECNGVPITPVPTGVDRNLGGRAMVLKQGGAWLLALTLASRDPSDCGREDRRERSRGEVKRLINRARGLDPTWILVDARDAPKALGHPRKGPRSNSPAQGLPAGDRASAGWYVFATREPDLPGRRFWHRNGADRLPGLPCVRHGGKITPSPWYSGERVGVRGGEADAEVISRPFLTLPRAGRLG